MGARPLEPKVRLVAGGPLSGRVEVPPSKSYTHRAVITASLSTGTSRVRNPLISRDTAATLDACRAMGATVDAEGDGLRVAGSEPHAAKDVVDVRNSGTTLRLMTSVFALPRRGVTVLTGDASIRRRPMQALLDAMKALGATARSSNGDGCAPIIVGEGGVAGGSVEVRGDVSSQFISSLLISSPLAREDTAMRVRDMVSRPYVEATLRLSALHGIDISRDGLSGFNIRGRQEYRPTDFTVPGDPGSAAFGMAAVALVGGRVEFSGLSTSLPHGDLAVFEIMTRLGVGVRARGSSVVVKADGERLRGGEFDLSDSPDLLPVLSVLALNCEEPVEIRGVAHARFKESDRVSVAAEGLRKMGAKVEERRDGLTIRRPDRLTPAVLDSHDDHRMFMAFSLASLLARGDVRVAGAGSVDVSYPGFLSDMKKMGIEVAKE